jgi:ribonuclease R
MGRKNSKKKIKARQGKSNSLLLKGTLDVSRTGMGYVKVEGLVDDVLIRPGDFNGAIHGDLVAIAIRERKPAGNRMKGIVKSVIKRKREEFIGQIQLHFLL